ncbi:MAG: EAL domain-containing protein [Lachnospiraceae bacterium]|nr:EAL domain-containing protein [Lachnospiraceae bacterium]
MQKQILIVEDNELNRSILSEILSGEYRVLEAENGQEALDILKRSRDSIALILLDVMMPVMDGYTFLDRLKEDAGLSLIPVIVMTQNDSETDEVAALSHGATDFVPKPYRSQVILHRVASLIKLRESAAMVNQFQYDRLTGLYSSEFFYQKVRERLDEDSGQEYTIVCSNIENFKLYNDTFGRESGDRLLKEFARAIRKIIGEDAICGRYNADRFLWLQRREKERRDREFFFHEQQSQRPYIMENISIKWGIYEIADRSIPVERMCDRALLAADSIKGQYNHNFAVYDDALRGKLLREKAITDSMESALLKGQFDVYFQPKYSLNDNCMAGAEALVRWNHPKWGMISPGEFIPLFEKNGFIPRLDRYVWEQVCMKLRDWHKKGYPLLPVSVNVSRADVYQVHLADTFLGLIKKYDIDPSYLHLEITESAYAESPGQIISTVENLRRLGFVVEMDDFGSGYSSLNMFSQMMLDILKLDMKFIQNEMAKSADQSILNDIVNMAHRMHLSVVAEGVETRNQMNRLRSVGCDYVQGYFFAKPMPAAEFEELLKSQSSHAVCSASGIKPNEIAVRSLLIADEDPGYREKVKQIFRDRYQILEAADADSALAYVRSDDISVVILSMTLPENGSALVLKSMRQDPVLWKIPVLAIIPNGKMLEELPLVMETDDFLCKCHPLFDLHRRVERLMEILAFQERESILQDEAARDSLTGLLNRRGLQAAVESIRREEMPLTVCMFDLDNLKDVNDYFGHNAGDRMIQSFANLLCCKTRSEDILCRYGGDEFVVILKKLNNEETVTRKVVDICRSFCDCLPEEQFPVSCSAGIVLCGADEKPSAELIERADQALYRAKKENKGGCCLWKKTGE